ncbi:MAG: hypothetical protein H6757_01140 [Candidatus Omnitrophica bacterium]|nr:hypothetical protein [Candidatus Omnitrophota bacterium]
MIANLFLFWLLLNSVFPYLTTPYPQVEIFLTYPPRIFCFAMCFIFAIYLWWKKSRIRLTLLSFAVILFAVQIGIGGGYKAVPADALRLLSLNTHEQLEYGEDLHQICLDNQIDIILLQEVVPSHWAHIEKVFSEYQFFVPDMDKDIKYKYSWSFALLTGIRKTLLNGAPVDVETGITQYRSFAVKANLRGRWMWIANVHMTKPISIHQGVLGFFERLQTKAAWHAEEGALLKKWVEEHDDLPLIAAGDYNAPYYSRYFHSALLTNAHRASGSGWHLSFPNVFPLWGIDHTFGNRWIQFYQYQTPDLGFSDHRAQVVWFGLKDGAKR